MGWPEVFTNPDFEYGPDSAAQAVRDGLDGWKIAGPLDVDDVPVEFGLGMKKVVAAAGCSALPEDLAARAGELGIL